MDARTLESLKASIAKWEKNAAGDVGKAKIYTDSCPLCEQFIDGSQICKGCPVAERTGEIGCVNSPWEDAEAAFVHGNGDEFRIAALAEVAFLKSLLPSDEAAK